MLNSFIQVGQKLREDKTAIEFLPFVELADVEEIKDGKGKIKQEKPKVQIYDFLINKDVWTLNKSTDPYDENIKPLFIKGDNNDRFYIAGDICSNYIGGNHDLKGYFHLDKGKKVKEFLDNPNNTIDEFLMLFRKNLSTYINSIENDIKEHLKNNKNKIYIKFRFIEEEKKYYWNDLYPTIESISNIIISTCYLENISGNLQAIRSPVSFYKAYNLNTLHNLDQANSYKSLDVRKSNEQLINLIVAEKYLSKKVGYFGKVLIQVIPAGIYNRKSILSFLGKNVFERDSEVFEEENNNNMTSDPFNLFEHSGIFKFDVLFLNKGSQTTDVITYISSLNKSDIEIVKENWKTARLRTQKEFEKIATLISPKIALICENEIAKKTSPFYSLSNLLKGFSSKDKKLAKYQMYALYKMLRKQYYYDKTILTGLIEKTEYGLRNEDDFINLSPLSRPLIDKN
ncbi:MAG: hypothetical protein ACOCXQ_04455 [Patescibacteria group bacterium]